MAILRDVHDSLASWLGDVLPRGTGLRFGAPGPDWNKRSDSAFVSLFLYGIRRDGRSPRSSGWTEVRDDEGKLVGRQPALAYYLLSYLVTAWAGTAGSAGDETGTDCAEHEILSALLDACASTEIIVGEHLSGSLAAVGSPTVVRCAGEPLEYATAPLWSGLGVAPRAHFVLEVVAPVVPPVVADLAPPAREIVLGTRRLQAGGALDAGRTAGISSRARRWERRTIDEGDGREATDGSA